MTDTKELAREPTDAMLDAAMAPYRHDNTKQFDDIFRETIRGYWRRMWDVAEDSQPTEGR